MEKRQDWLKSSFRHIIDNCRKIKQYNKTGQKFLDVGCGKGDFAILAAELGYKSYGIDPVKDRIIIALQKKSKVLFSIGIGENLPFSENQFDIIIVNETLEHVKNWRKTIDECVRCLKTDGVLFLSTSNKQHPFTHEVRNFPLFPYLPEYIQHKFTDFCLKHRPDIINHTTLPVNHYFTHNEIRKYLSKYQLKIYDEIQLYDKNKLRSYKKILGYFWNLTDYSIVRWIIYFFMSSTRFYAVKAEADGTVSHIL